MIKKAESLMVDKIVPGHGISANKNLLTQNRELLNTIYSTVKIMNKLKKYINWGNVDSELGRYIIKAVLEVEQAEFE
ncbi:MAG: hypothetical protein KZQ83_04025 [gamma proteobacterium symbiont of Taylorina sp.]|nr:hypothetical protein [gamma proteobacterium symbiont of Taylorina sp.]